MTLGSVFLDMAVIRHDRTILRDQHEEPQAVIFLHGIWRHIKEFGIEGQIPRISSPVKLEKRC